MVRQHLKHINEVMVACFFKCNICGTHAALRLIFRKIIAEAKTYLTQLCPDKVKSACKYFINWHLLSCKRHKLKIRLNVYIVVTEYAAEELPV